VKLPSGAKQATTVSRSWSSTAIEYSTLRLTSAALSASSRTCRYASSGEPGSDVVVVADSRSMGLSKVARSLLGA
jgi:hypothetical protein